MSRTRRQRSRGRRIELILRCLLASTLILSIAASAVFAAEEPSGEHPGLALLLTEPLSFSPLDVSELEELWTVWPEPARTRAQDAGSEERRRLTFTRYGLIPRGEGDASALPLGYASDESGRLYPNCFSCHGGSVAGRTVPGLANNQQDLTQLVGDLAALRAKKRGGDAEVARRGATLGFPLNFSRGTSNATMYSILLGSMRDDNLDLQMPRLSQEFVHNSIDAPPWWHFKRKQRIYWDGMAPKTVRTLMQFTMAPGLSGERIRGWEGEFETIRDYISSIEPPKYPFQVDAVRAERGKGAFESVCSRCHGTYGENPTYPERVIPLAEIGTDPVRLTAIQPASKTKYNQSWFADYGKHPVVVDTKGYVAPPLDGIWASAPYFHNGSVPTLLHVLNPEQRPNVWRRRDALLESLDGWTPKQDQIAASGSSAAVGYDTERVGLWVEVLTKVPTNADDASARNFYDTSLPSQSNQGHLFPLELSPQERREVLEYLKTL